jgi:OPT family oligopeptide transporter
VAVYPCGKFFAYLLPIRNFALPRWFGGGEFSLNPGPFNIKEHTVIVIMANASVGPAYALYMTVSTELWYNHNYGVGFSILFVLATQITGFSFAGICRRFVIWPASMIWPGNLVITTNLNVLHAEDDGYTGGVSRFQFFMYAIAGAFAWYFLPGEWSARGPPRPTHGGPGFLFTALSYFSYACWIAPNNLVVNELFGVVQGMGMGILTFDWLQISWIGSPLVTPWWAELNIGLGFILFYWIIVPIMYYKNVSLCPLDSADFDRYGSPHICR